uniref:Uncharacterized protein n=1 Tax=Rhizophora mucronata TaxID=61149 RepID=A0A2P2PT39_RHIMU
MSRINTTSKSTPRLQTQDATPASSTAYRTATIKLQTILVVCIVAPARMHT